MAHGREWRPPSIPPPLPDWARYRSPGQRAAALAAGHEQGLHLAAAAGDLRLARLEVVDRMLAVDLVLAAGDLHAPVEGGDNAVHIIDRLGGTGDAAFAAEEDIPGGFDLIELLGAGLVEMQIPGQKIGLHLLLCGRRHRLAAGHD